MSLVEGVRFCNPETMKKACEGTCYIYALCDPVAPDDIRYIGKTIDLRGRYRKHLALAQGGPKATRLYIWLQGLKLKGRKPLLFVVEEVLLEHWQEAEKDWIAFYREVGHPLLNDTIGGDGIPVGSNPEVGRKIAAALRGRTLSPEVRDKIRESVNRAVQRNPIEWSERGRRNGLGNRGYIHNAESRAKSSAAAKRRDPSTRTPPPLASFRGHNHTPESVVKIRTAILARPILICDRCGQKIRGGKGNLTQHQKSAKCGGNVS